MAKKVGSGGKFVRLARTLHWSGALFVSSKLPPRDSLLIVNYHRIGNAEEDLFDPGVFSATAEDFYEQIEFLKRNVEVVTLEEALAFVDGTQKDKTRRCRVLITFDDGYLDNYEIAHPILRSHGVQGVFFLVTSMVGSNHIPWWDQISYMMKSGGKRRFSLAYPANLEVDVDRNGMAESLRSVLRLYKRPENLDPARFMRETAEAIQGAEPPSTVRRFLNWDEAREMSREGAAIGSHTHSHNLLSHLEPERQYEELAKSRAILNEQLGIAADTIAYPVGKKDAFTDETKRIAQEVGYRAGFSFYGGANLPGQTSPYDVRRFDIGPDLNHLRLELEIFRLTGHVRQP